MPLSNVEIIHQDAALLVINKPTLLLSVPGRAEDNRDCLVTRLQESDDWHDLGPRRAQWVPYLLDVQARCLYGPGPDLGCMPLFEGLAGGRLSLRVFDSDWQVDEEAGTPCELALETMLGWPAQQLGACGRLWLETNERARAGQWQRLDDDHLDTWRKKWK